MHLSFIFMLAILSCMGEKEVKKEDGNIMEIVKRLSVEIKSQNQKIKCQSEKIEELKQEIISQQKQFSKDQKTLTERLDSVQTTLSTKGSSAFPDRTHAFYARRTTPITRVSVDTVIVYEEVILNYGGFYNQNVGQYVAPLRGIYVFMMNAFTYHAHTDVQLRHNRNEVSKMWVMHNGDNHIGSMMAILLLQQFDEVHTVLQSGHSLNGHGHSQWGGFLLSPV